MIVTALLAAFSTAAFADCDSDLAISLRQCSALNDGTWAGSFAQSVCNIGAHANHILCSIRN